MICNFKLLTQTAKLPCKNHQTDAGIDFFSDQTHLLHPEEHFAYSTGVSWEPYFDAREEGFGLNNFFKIYMQIQGRSGLAVRDGIAVLGGVIDAEYRGDIKIILLNTSEENVEITKGMKIAQGIVLLTPNVIIKMTEYVGETLRGNGGFGSSGF
jgi:dUTP pyrophosphatase